MAQIVFANLSLIGFLDGLTATCIIIFSVLFGLISFYHARKLKARLLAIAGLTMITVGLLWLGPAIDFFMVLLTGNNLNPQYIYGWLSYVSIAPAIVVGFLLGAELMVPKWKKEIVIFYTILGVIFEFFLFMNPAPPTGIFVFNAVSEGDLIDSGFNRNHFAYYLIAFFLISVFIFLVIGFAIKAKQATGDLRKKFLYLFIGELIFFICGMADSLFQPGLY